MRISRTTIEDRWLHRKNEECLLTIKIVGTEEELQELAKIVEFGCSKKEP